MSPVETLRGLQQQGALLLDVRTPPEFASSHAPGSINIPLDALPTRWRELDPDRPILVCCASGARSGWAKTFLERQGFRHVQNAGPWQRLVS